MARRVTELRWSVPLFPGQDIDPEMNHVSKPYNHIKSYTFAENTETQTLFAVRREQVGMKIQQLPLASWNP